MGMTRGWGSNNNNCSLEQQVMNSSEKRYHGVEERLGQQRRQLQSGAAGLEQ